MKVKTGNRIVGGGYALIYGLGGYTIDQYLFSKIFDESPLEIKIATGLGIIVTTPVAIYGVANGLIDLIKGTHNYLGLHIWEYLTKSKESKEKIRQGIGEMMRRRDYDAAIFFKPKKVK